MEAEVGLYLQFFTLFCRHSPLNVAHVMANTGTTDLSLGQGSLEGLKSANIELQGIVALDGYRHSSSYRRQATRFDRSKSASSPCGATTARPVACSVSIAILH